jgi:hypothetical protein
LIALTVKLRSCPEAPDQAPPAHTVFRAGGADTLAVHGPLQRLLGVAVPRVRSQDHAHRPTAKANQNTVVMTARTPWLDSFTCVGAVLLAVISMLRNEGSSTYVAERVQLSPTNL